MTPIPLQLMRKLIALAALAPAIVYASSLQAQNFTVTCDSGCDVAVSSVENHRTVRFTVSDKGNGVPGAKISAITSSGKLFPDTTTADSHGRARFVWTPASPRSASAITVHARTANGGSSAIAYVPMTTESPPLYSLNNYANSGYGALEKTHIRHPIWLEVRRMANAGDIKGTTITDASECNARKVTFRNLSPVGSLPGDTARGELSESIRADETGVTKCFVQTTWYVGEGAGERQALASLVTDPAAAHQHQTARIVVRARALPRLIAGPALMFGRTYYAAAKPSGTPIRVERVLPGSRKIVYDSLPPGARVDTVSNGNGPQVSPLVGASVAIWPRRTPATLLVGMNLASPTDDFFFGTSLLRLIKGTETWPIDVNLLGRVGRRRELINHEACALDAAQCATEKRTGWGYGFTFTFDASSLLAEAVKKLAGS